MIYTAVGVKCPKCGITKKSFSETAGRIFRPIGLLLVVAFLSLVVTNQLVRSPRYQPKPTQSGDISEEVTPTQQILSNEEPDEGESPSIEWIDEKGSFDSQGYFVVTGKVRNIGNEEMDVLRIWAFFLDETGQAIEISLPLVFENLQAGEVRYFAFRNESQQNSLRVKTFRLQAEFKFEDY